MLFFTLLIVLLFSLLTLLILPAFIFYGIAKRKAEKFRYDYENTVVAQYDPPHGFTPAEIGLLYDMRCDNLEIMATLFDLEQRQIVKIINKNKVELINEKAFPNLPDYEKIAIRLAKGESDNVKTKRMYPLKFVNPNTGGEEVLYLQLPQKQSRLSFSLAVQDSLKKKGIKTKSYTKQFIARTIIVAIVLSLTPMLLVFLPGTFNNSPYTALSLNAFLTSSFTTFIFAVFFFPAYLISSFIIVFIWSRVAGRYWINTKEARKFWPEIEGYKLYLENVDLDNIQFESENAHDGPVTKTFPYALVYGLDTKWRKRLKTPNKPTLEQSAQHI